MMIEAHTWSICKSIISIVDQTLRGGACPQMCREILAALYIADDKKQRVIPTIAELKARKAYIKKADVGDYTLRQTLEWASERMCTTSRTLFDQQAWILA